MNQNEFLQDAIGMIDETLVEGALTAKPMRSRLRHVLIAACLSLMLLAIPLGIVIGNQGKTPADTTVLLTDPADTAAVTYQPHLFSALESPENISGDHLNFITGSSIEIEGGLSAPPAFEFNCAGIVVKAKAVECLPDSYHKLLLTGNSKPTTYRLIRFETLEVLNGIDVPESFLYLLPEYLFVDLTAYDEFLISMYPLFYENYILCNQTQNKLEAFSEQIFCDDWQDLPQLGNIIAFTDGIFDESLWQTPSWIYGYQFGRLHLEEETYVVKRGGSIEQAIGNIQKEIDAWNALLDDRYPNGSNTVTYTPPAQMQSEEAKAAYQYVKPFVNGVFVPEQFNNWCVYRRYINGCPTDETVSFNLATEEVTYSKVRYTKEDLAAIDNLALHIAEKAADYQINTPIPPHIEPEGKKLYTLSLFGWYFKKDGKVFGVIKTVWIYKQEESEYFTIYYDDNYALYDSTEKTCRNLSRDDLVEFSQMEDYRNVYRYEFGDYGEPYVVPFC